MLNRKMDNMRNLQCQMLEKRVCKKRVVDSSSSSDGSPDKYRPLGRNAVVGIAERKVKRYSPFPGYSKMHSSFVLK